MAQLFKRTKFAAIPDGAVISDKGGEKWAVWTDDAGKRRKAMVTAKGDKIILGERARWFCKLRVGKTPNHKWKAISLFTDKTASERELVRRQATEDQRAAGVITPEMEHAGKPLSVHIADYLASMKQLNVSPDHLRISKWTLDKLIEMSGWSRVSDMTGDSLRLLLAKLAAAGYATNYINKFTSRAKALVHWMQQNGRLTVDPFAGVKRGNAAKGKKTRARRALEPDAATALLSVVPADRQRKYLFAMLSGLRRGELADLRWADLKLNATIPFFQLREEQTKNDKNDAIPIHPALLRVLKDIPAGEDNDRVLGQMPDMKTMAKDLLRAGLATLSDVPTSGIRIGKGKYVCIADARGRRTDFHSLRHTFKTWVDRTGCTESTSDALTRHGDKTVGDGYRHSELADMAEALRKIPDPMPTTAVEVQATGTTGATAIDVTTSDTTGRATIGPQLATIGDTDLSHPQFCITSSDMARIAANTLFGGSGLIRCSMMIPMVKILHSLGRLVEHHSDGHSISLATMPSPHSSR